MPKVKRLKGRKISLTYEQLLFLNHKHLKHFENAEVICIFHLEKSYVQQQEV